MARRAIPLLVLLLAWGGPTLRAAEETAAEPRWDRVAGLCRAWTAAKYLHPGLWSSDLDWDAAFAEAATAVANEPEATPERYRLLAAAMLARLGDPASEVTSKNDRDQAAGEGAAPAAPAAAGDVALVRELAPGVVLFDLPAVHATRGLQALATELAAALRERVPGSRGVVIDLRLPPSDGLWWTAAALDQAAAHLVPAPVVVPGDRWIVHWGYAPHQGRTSGGYQSALVTSAGREIHPAAGGGDWRVVFLLDEPLAMPDVGRALTAANLARTVTAEHPAAGAEGNRVAVDLGEGLTAWVRVSEPVLAGKPAAPIVLATAAAADPRRAIEAAVSLLAAEWPAAPAATAAPATPVSRRPEAAYPEMTLPPAGHRLLAACRTWGVIHHFYPYLPLIGDWDAAFRDSLPAFFAAGSETDYVRAVLALVAHVADDHTGVHGHPAVGAVVGAAFPPLAVRLVEGQVVIVAADPALSDVRVGDVVRTVDGEPIAARIDRHLPLTPASTPVTLRTRAARRALGGDAGTKAVLELEGADGIRRVTVDRLPNWRRPEESGPAWRRVKPDVGYVDLRRLQVPEVATMLEELRDTTAIVFDMRGYPKGTAWTLAPRLGVRGAGAAALFRRPELSFDSFYYEDAGYHFAQPIPERGEDDWVYQGRTVMLIDEQAISQAEHTALFLEAAAGTVFVGQPTAGANGDVTNFVLPGGVLVGFTGHDVRHADGRQLQRVGIQPDVPVAPTLAGVRAGRDEVLERALQWLDEQGSPAAGAAATMPPSPP